MMLPTGSWASQINYQLRQSLEKDMQTSQLEYSWEDQTLSQVNLGCVKLTIKKKQKNNYTGEISLGSYRTFFFRKMYMLEVFVFNLIRSSFSVYGVCVLVGSWMLWYVGWRTTLLQPLSSFHYGFPGLTWHGQASTAGAFTGCSIRPVQKSPQKVYLHPMSVLRQYTSDPKPFPTSPPPHFQQMVQTDNESQDSGTHNPAYTHMQTNMISLCFPRNPCFWVTHTYPSPDPDRQKAKCLLTPRFLCILPHWTQIGKWIHVSCFWAYLVFNILGNCANDSDFEEIT